MSTELSTRLVSVSLFTVDDPSVVNYDIGLLSYDIVTTKVTCIYLVIQILTKFQVNVPWILF